MPLFLARAAVAFVALLVLMTPAGAVIKKLTPLKEVIGDATTILVAEVDSVDSDKPSTWWKFKENLKGKSSWESFAINLKGDAFAKKDGHVPAMIERLTKGRTLVLFVTPVEKTYVAFGFLEGTWFQLRGTTAADGKTVVWAFLHCEPFFRRTFKGTTAELKAVVEKAVAGTAAPPEANEKEEPGLGPVPEKKGAAIRSPMLFGVIPTAVLIAPLAVVAALFPGVFARLAMTMKQWRAFLAFASVNTTIGAIYFSVRGWLPDHWLASPKSFLVLMTANALVGAVWAGQRHRRTAPLQPTSTDAPTRNQLYGLAGAVAALVVVVVLPVWIIFGRSQLLELPVREFIGMIAGLALAFVYAAYRIATRSIDPPEAKPKLGLSGETVALAGMVLFGFAMLATGSRSNVFNQTGAEQGDAVDSAIGPKLADIRTFAFPGANEVYSGLALDDAGRLYFGAESKGGTGSVWCVDPASGAVNWKFTNEGDLQPVYCIPTIADGKVYVGEGLHSDSERRMFCLDAKNGQALWNFKTESHTEGRAAIAGSKLVFCAGDDGLYCIDPKTQAKLWHFAGTKQNLHIDTPPAVRGRRVFFGSGYNTLALLCVDINTGDELWRTPIDLRSFGAPLARGNHVYFGLGTGNLLEDLSSEPETSVQRETVAKGAIVCVDAATGKENWRYDLPKSVHSEMSADLRAVYACCKDGTVYAIDRASGKLRWKRKLGEAFAAGPALATHANGAATVAVYAVTLEGRVACLNPSNGDVFWQRDLAEQAGKIVQVLSTPVVSSGADGTRTLLIGAKGENRNNGERVATVFRIVDAIED
jgi:outer membrane protein assembly factor BamB